MTIFRKLKTKIKGFFFFFFYVEEIFHKTPSPFSVGFLPTKTSTVACILFCLGAPGPDYSPVLFKGDL